MSLWRKLSLLGKAFTSRRELEDELSRQLFELAELESSLKSQLAAIETAQMLLQNDRSSLVQLDELLADMKSSVVINMRDWAETRDAIVAIGRSVVRQESQLNDMTSLVKSLQNRLEAGLARATEVKDALKNLGKVIKWTKRKI